MNPAKALSSDDDYISQSELSPSQDNLSISQKNSVFTTPTMKNTSGTALERSFSEGTASAHMNAMNSSKIGVSSESESPAFFENHSALSLTRVSRTETGRDVTQVEHQENVLSKKADSPGSVAFRISNIQAAKEKDNFFATRKISFDPSFGEEEETEKADTLPQFLGKAKRADIGTDKEFKRSIRQLKKLVTDLEIGLDDIAENDPERFENVVALNVVTPLEIKPVLLKLVALAPEKAEERSLRVAGIYGSATPELQETLCSLLSSIAYDDTAQEEDRLLSTIKLFEVHFILAGVRAAINQIPEEDPEHSSKVAAAYVSAYPEVKEKLQSLLAAIECATIPKNKSTALALGAIAIQVVEVAFKSVDVMNVEPIKIQEGIDDPMMTARQVPWKSVPYNELELSDDEAANSVHEAADVVLNLRESMNVFNINDESLGTVLHTSQAMRINRVADIAVKKKSSASRIAISLLLAGPEETSTALAQAKITANAAHNYYKECRAQSRNIPRISDPVQARKTAIHDIVSVARTTLDYSDQLINMFSSRKK